MDMKKEIYLVQEGAFWAKIQSDVQNSVVQVFAQIGRFNWREPYKVEEQYENRGSGFLIDERGYLITNAHVVDQAKHIWVHVPVLGQQPLEAHVVAICPDRDFALLRITDEGLQYIRENMGGIPFLTFGDSDYVQRTDSVLVLGYPLGQYRLKSTTGIISGRESIYGHSLLQITAPVNPGSSGGPMLNVRGQVIGITIAMVPIAQNIGYVIPINELKIVLADMYSKRFVRKPLLGARFIYASDEKARYFNNPTPPGLYIGTVFKGSLLEKAGVHEGDMLYAFNGFRLDAYGETNVPWSLDKVSLYDLVSRMKVGDKAQLIIYRNGERKDITFAVEYLQPFSIRQRFPDYEPIEYDMLGGLVVMDLADNHLPFLILESPELICYKEPAHRMDPVLVVTYVLPGSYAHQLRTLKPGVIIHEVNGKKVKTLADWKQSMQKSLETGLIMLKTDIDVLVVFSLEKLLKNEERLSKAFVYPISKTVQKLQRAVQRKQKPIKKQ